VIAVVRFLGGWDQGYGLSGREVRELDLGGEKRRRAGRH